MQDSCKRERIEHMELSEEDLRLINALQISPRISWSDAGDVQVTVPYGMYRVDASAYGGGNVKVDGVIRDDLAPQAIDAVTDIGNITVRAR